MPLRVPDVDSPSNKPCNSRRAFQKEGHCVVKLETLVGQMTSSSWRVITPQLMGRFVRQRCARCVETE